MKKHVYLLFCLIFASSSLNLAFGQTNQPKPGTPAYDYAKANGLLTTPQIKTLTPPATKSMPDPEIFQVNGDDDTPCYTTYDSTWTSLAANDDGSTSQINLPFTFNMYGTAYTSVYVNNNGNITFNSSLSGYTASGFPISTPMVAPFWADVDTRGAGSDLVWYKVTPTALYVNYPGVGYFPSEDDKLNTFQVIITDGNDPSIGVGNNVAFYYGDMQWTTGSASGGSGGFGGTSATVGVNSGDNTNFFQIGRFNQAGDNYAGPYDLDGGIDWLDGKCFTFNVNSEGSTNIPPLVQSISANSATICAGESTDISWAFTGPESDQEVTVMLADSNNTGSAITSSTTTDETTTGVLHITAATPGTYHLYLVASDDGDPVESTTIDITVIVTNCGGPDCAAEAGSIALADESTSVTVCVDDDEPSMVDVMFLSPPADTLDHAWLITDADGNLLNAVETMDDVEAINFDDAGVGHCKIWYVSFDIENSNLSELGDASEAGETINISQFEGCIDLSNAIDVIRVNCQEPPTTDCQDFVYYLSDHSAADGISSIYKVTLSGGNANLDLIAVSDIEVHIAYNSMDNLIYAVSKHENSYRTLSPIDGTFGPTQSLGGDYGEITAAVFNADGKLLIGSQDHNMIYSVNVSTNAVSTYDTYSPLYGGDLAFASDGMLYLATRTGSGLYENWPAATMPDQLIGTVPDHVTGMAITDSDQLLISSRDHTSLEVRNTDGSNPGITYPVMLDGEPYTLRDGDMASGCNTGTFIEGDCDAFTTFYVNHGPEIDGSDLYTVGFTTGGLAIMNYVTNVAFEAHIAFNAAGDLLYFVNADGSGFSVYDVTGDAFLGDVAFTGTPAADLSKITAVIFDQDNGNMYIGDDNTNIVYKVDVLTGDVSFYANAPVSGGDLAILNDENIYLATRTDHKLYQVVEGGSAVMIGDIAPYVTGMARWNDAASLVISNRGTTEFKQINTTDASVMNTYTATLDGSIFSLSNGDMAAGCVDPDQSIEGCFGSDVLDYEQGSQTNGNPVAADRSDPNTALGEPDRSNAPGGFFSLGVGGHITIGFAGVVNDEPGDDIRIWETSYSGDVCSGSSDERADIELSADGINFVPAGTICRDGAVDMADAGLTSVVAIRITNAASTGTPDGYDVDGVEAINGCSELPDDGTPQLVEAEATLTSYPNPTSGSAEVVFTTPITGQTLVEVYDMNGRNVATLFNQEAQANQQYRLDFNGQNLPNGIYIYRMTTNNETIISKFMIAK